MNTFYNCQLLWLALYLLKVSHHICIHHPHLLTACSDSCWRLDGCRCEFRTFSVPNHHSFGNEGYFKSLFSSLPLITLVADSLKNPNYFGESFNCAKLHLIAPSNTLHPINQTTSRSRLHVIPGHTTSKVTICHVYNISRASVNITMGKKPQLEAGVGAKCTTLTKFIHQIFSFIDHAPADCRVSVPNQDTDIVETNQEY
jgi:hypothetical protein